ncbi:hypothetical protein Cgig2_003020 [Carnegiea gigantea]|uniref:PCI domain-containing protein n=1 Tax=Carnegiea gigantea TaxID=171969 RepID=A0A9Q1JHK3_9CARY|nr:hypothetical protein Cgig2_003020 [Carnegiea gigantea]
MLTETQILRSKTPAAVISDQPLTATIPVHHHQRHHRPSSRVATSGRPPLAFHQNHTPSSVNPFFQASPSTASNQGQRPPLPATSGHHLPISSPENASAGCHPVLVLSSSLADLCLILYIIVCIFTIKYKDVVLALRRGDLRLLRCALQEHEDRYIIQKHKDPSKAHQVKLDVVVRALKWLQIDMDVDEVECIVAILIYKGLIKGYFAHKSKVVVLSKQDPFPN